MGPSTKDGRRFKKQITRTKKTLERLLDQRAMWMRLGSNGSEEDFFVCMFSIVFHTPISVQEVAGDLTA